MTDEQKKEYIRKKEIVMKALELIFDEWEMAKPIYDIVNSTQVTPELIDTLIDMIDNSFKNIDEKEKKEKMQSAINSLKAIKEKEKLEKDEEIKSISDNTILNYI